MIELQSIRHRQGSFALSIDASCTSPRLAFYGPSGSGKTTLIELIAGLRRVQQGRIIVDGRTLDDSERKIHLPAERRRIGYVPQDETLFPHLDVRGNIFFAASRQSDSMSRMLTILELDRLMERAVTTLSGGEKRRVAIARALAVEPSLLLLDEPLAGLDAARREEAMSLLETLFRETATPSIIVSHQRDEIDRLADEVITLESTSPDEK